MRTARRVDTRPNPAGAKWMKVKALVRARYGDTCHLCGHAEARQTDHIVPVSERPDMAWHLGNLRPCHGGGHFPNPCPTCGLHCNQVRGTRSVEAAKVLIAQRQQQQALTLFPRRGQSPRRGRVWLREAGRWRQAGRVRSRRPSAVKSVACQPTCAPARSR